MLSELSKDMNFSKKYEILCKISGKKNIQIYKVKNIALNRESVLKV
jgi:hypothetical protein